MVEQAGFSSLGIAIPETAIKLSELAALRGEDPNKYEIGLQCFEMTVCKTYDETIDLATAAAQKAIARYHGSQSDIGLIVVATESAKDMSKPLSSFVQEKLNLSGAIRSYEIKHACLSGTIAIKQASEWVLSGAAKGKAALVIAADQSLYTPNTPAEPTQGAGAVAFIIDEAATIATIERESWTWSEPAYDFWRPVGDPYPQLDGQLSLECYIKASLKCFEQMMSDKQQNPSELFDSFKAICFHNPFSKMVFKSFKALCEQFNFSEETMKEYYNSHVDPYLEYNKKIGNAYTASLWISVAHALQTLKCNDQIAAFSYGSGFGSELLNFTKTTDAANIGWEEDIKNNILTQRTYLTKEEYAVLRGESHVPFLKVS